MYAIGLMSGTSLDGIDVVLCKIEGNYLDTKLEVVAEQSYPMAESLKKEIKQACDPKQSSVDLICSLNFKLGKVFANSIKELCKEINFPIEKVDFIASHGQTIYHIPEARQNYAKSTLQIGEAAVITYETKVQTISNFRVMDMAAGGQGAPLVPYSEFILYSTKNENVALQNIGGIGNVTVLPKSQNLEEVFAFDTGPGNMVIDEMMVQLYQKPYDNNGEIAKKGTINNEMLQEMLADSYLEMVPPKTTGREVYGKQYVEKLLQKYGKLESEDLIATVTYFTAKTIAINYEKFILPNYPLSKVIIGGGGAYNATLMHHLQTLLPNIKVLKQEDIGYSSSAKEAIAFVILGNETLHQHFSNVKSATGAQESVVLGNITPVPMLVKGRN